ncbi:MULTISPECIES: thiamine pyrophosphate-binding protein [unclassified Brenneria]|uniref:thiamine pyrophosphate-binding protein n=1 Tax=unclassified Brenneria TaxID=2634434 RepID=UPI0029C33AA0|nr:MULTISPECIES: thiamine pyrophosphate-binding protein [unclassified Brenneria]MDX5627504.1 thiamine pyrophosphate-binding protein [Brenneria sp. L3-3Z]MDX5694340.1 thiamine pyrophosphate-binding protein [Brenneria sp. L4-2C]MEE3662076.1 thiamine pyrophosphate-binding protein [Brenneria sp. g21c3]
MTLASGADVVTSARPADAAARKVADAVAETLVNFGARFVFGIPGNDVLELMRACEEQDIRYVLARSEPSCAFMADAVYQLTGAPGVVLPALGPGLANMVSGIAGALQDRSALLVLAGSVERDLAGIYSHQIIDQTALMRPVTLYADTLNPARSAQQTARALDIATGYPPGPVFLDVAADVSRAPSAEPAFSPQSRHAGGYLSQDEQTQIVSMLRGAERPLALIGQGALFGPQPQTVSDFIQASGLPFLTTYKAKGIVSEYHPNSLGALGLSPVIDAIQREAVDAADLLVLIGFDPIELRSAWLDAWPAGKTAITLDWAALNQRIFPAGRAYYGNLHGNLQRLQQRWNSEPPARRADCQRHRARLAPLVSPPPAHRDISPAALFAELDRQMTAEWLVTLDVGAHRILANHVIRCRRPRQLLQSNGFGCMGYSLPAAIAAQLLYPRRPVIAVTGDGGLLMTLGELTVARDLALPLVVIVLNDAALSLIRLKQSKSGLDERGVRFRETDFALVAQGMGARGIRAHNIDEFRQALREAVAGRQFTVIDAAIDPTEYTCQM